MRQGPGPWRGWNSGSLNLMLHQAIGTRERKSYLCLLRSQNRLVDQVRGYNLKNISSLEQKTKINTAKSLKLLKIPDYLVREGMFRCGSSSRHWHSSDKYTCVITHWWGQVWPLVQWMLWSRHSPRLTNRRYYCAPFLFCPIFLYNVRVS